MQPVYSGVVITKQRVRAIGRGYTIKSIHFNFSLEIFCWKAINSCYWHPHKRFKNIKSSRIFFASISALFSDCLTRLDV